jgi:hypothetical protein
MRCDAKVRAGFKRAARLPWTPGGRGHGHGGARLAIKMAATHKSRRLPAFPCSLDPGIIRPRPAPNQEVWRRSRRFANQVRVILANSHWRMHSFQQIQRGTATFGRLGVSRQMRKSPSHGAPCQALQASVCFGRSKWRFVAMSGASANALAFLLDLNSITR